MISVETLRARLDELESLADKAKQQYNWVLGRVEELKDIIALTVEQDKTPDGQ